MQGLVDTTSLYKICKATGRKVDYLGLKQILIDHGASTFVAYALERNAAPHKRLLSHLEHIGFSVRTEPVDSFACIIAHELGKRSALESTYSALVVSDEPDLIPVLNYVGSKTVKLLTPLGWMSGKASSRLLSLASISTVDISSDPRFELAQESSKRPENDERDNY